MSYNPDDFNPSDDDDCPEFGEFTIGEGDYTFSASDGESSVEIRVTEHPEKPGEFFADVVLDAEHFSADLETMAGPYASPCEACVGLAHHFNWFLEPGNSDNGEEVELCGDAKQCLQPRPSWDS
jgi:hypothetical protein